MWAPAWTRLRFRDITAADGYTVCRWRNTQSAREAFFDRSVVTPDTHAAFVRSRKPHDLVWMVEEKDTGDAVGMLSLTVDPVAKTAEYGRAYLDERYRGRGYWLEAEWMMLHFAFDVLVLESVWLDIYADNAAMCAVHRKFGWSESRSPRFDAVNGRPVLGMTYTAAQWAERHEAMFAAVTAKHVSEAMG